MQGNGGTAAVRRRRSITLPDGTAVEIEQMTFRDFMRVREEACAEYKRGLIQTYTRNIDLVPTDRQATIIQEAFEKAEKVTPDTLPTHTIRLPKRTTAGKIVRDAAGAIVMEEQVIEYATWWMAETSVGKVFALWLAASKCNPKITREWIEEKFTDSPDALDDAANVIGELSEPRLGNAAAADQAPQQTAQTGP